jgi:hypothetical protein
LGESSGDLFQIIFGSSPGAAEMNTEGHLQIVKDKEVKNYEV